MLKIYYNKICPFSRKLRVVLQEKKIEFTLVEVKYWERENDFLLLNPAAETPVLITENDNVISSNYAIFEYIESLSSNQSFFVHDICRDAQIRRISDWFDRKLYNEVTKYILSEKILKIIDKNLLNATPNSASIRAAKKNILYHLDYIAFLLNEDHYLCGSQITLADYAAAAQISVLDLTNDVPWDYNVKVKSWYALIKSRASFRNVLLDEISHITPPLHYLDPDF